MLKEWRWAEEEVPGSRLTDRCPVSNLLTYEIQCNEAIKSVRNQRATSAEIAAASWSEEGPETERDKKPE